MLVHLASLVGTALCRLRPLGKSTFVPSAWLSWNSAEAQQYWSLGKVHDARLFQPVPRGILRQKEILRTAMIQILLAGLLLLLTALLGLLTWLTVAWFAFPQLLSGEVWHPLLIPLVGIIITTGVGHPLHVATEPSGIVAQGKSVSATLIWLPMDARFFGNWAFGGRLKHMGDGAESGSPECAHMFHCGDVYCQSCDCSGGTKEVSNKYVPCLRTISRSSSAAIRSRRGSASRKLVCRSGGGF